MLPSDGRTSTVPPWSTGAVPSFMPPTPTFPSYWPTATNPPPLFGASASEAVETNPDVFTSEDRLALRLIFHQQQAIQAQQNAIISWLQQITTLLSHMDRPGRPSTDFTAATTTMPPPARRASGVHADAVPPVERKAETTTANLSSTAGDDPRRSSSRGEDAHRRLEAHLKLETPNVGGSRSCTPPGDDGAASHNRSIDSIAAPWDPNNRLGSSFRSVRSSHGGSQLGRLENPLLSSSQASLLRQRATRGADVTSARMLSRPGSANTTQLQEQTGISGFAQSGSLLSTSLQRSGDSLSQRPHPVVAPPRRGGVGSAFHSSSAGGDQESERPVPPYRRAPEPGAPQTADPVPISPNPTRVMAVAEASPASIRSMGFYSAHGEESRAEDESRDLRAAQPAKRAALGQPTGISDDSLSDGCGSYETRKYLKEIGLF